MKKLTPTKLQAIRTSLGISQPTMAALLGVHEITISKWEHGKLKPSAWQEEVLRAFEKAAEEDPEIKQEVTAAVAEFGITYTLCQLLMTAFGKR